ncbi:D-hexose-6-phosphate mutarotase [Shewanella psychromarinicola]|uniref:Putative glucose-6-phosphate 1-epimerase n=1 Tax=Shewanella psychromarinicola TaxID=2487742 RepID=A0A3N4DMZ1_9GAMM|nr:D-hexose-6-phosphate mutarotase [Shewanella psychromarinicola]AZG35956.1 D-hexose-6-phosphate mutarotase [Shewanella psychromarinicola]MCL1082874.1 D-hexose-6-phosphate mutarotase [Shewanella psychromarinicola]RPA23511.1 D-hexose-6-phosphate mutarotase [Shewanella psychromarinicola]
MGLVTTKRHPNGLDYVAVDTTLCQARIFMQGAQIDQFTPAGKEPLLWVSNADDYQPGNGIRGGIPICWPWFGMSNTLGFPQHGFARNKIWSLESVKMRDQLVDLIFTLPAGEIDKQYWPHDSQIKVLFTLGETLSVSLVNTNNAHYDVTLTQALHSYFPIENIHQLTASGFEGSQYIEFGEGPFKQDDDVVQFDQETDRVYTKLAHTQELHTQNGTIVVSRENSQSAVLWNPWIDKSVRLSRFNPDDYLTMVCLEAANVLEDYVLLAPGQSHTMTTHIGWK